jgi:hypothetical protein
MKYLIPSIFAVAALAIGLQASADDQKDPATKQAWKQCMTQMQAQNQSWTHEQLKAACKTQMKNNPTGATSTMTPSDSTAPSTHGADSNPNP